MSTDIKTSNERLSMEIKASNDRVDMKIKSLNDRVDKEIKDAVVELGELVKVSMQRKVFFNFLRSVKHACNVCACKYLQSSICFLFHVLSEGFETVVIYGADICRCIMSSFLISHHSMTQLARDLGRQCLSRTGT